MMKLRHFGLVASLVFFALLGATPAKADWRRAESPNFILYSTQPEAQLRQRILLLEDYDRLLRRMISVTDPPAPNKLHIYIVDGNDDLQLIRPTSTMTAGMYEATADGIAAFVDDSTNMSGNEILFHEYAHHFMLQYRPNAYPIWYVEGFAEYFMTARFSPSRIDIGDYSSSRSGSIRFGEWLPMERVLNGDLRGLNDEQRAQFYAQAWITTHYFYSTPERQAALARYLVALRGDNPQNAIQAATGMDAAAFGREISHYVGTGHVDYWRMPRPANEAVTPVTVTTLSRGANDLLLYEAALRVGVSDEKGHAYLPRIRAAAARHEGDAFAQTVLAHAELLYGDAAAADRLLDGLLAASPNDADLLYLKGMRHLVAAEREENWQADAGEARRWFGRAHQADAHHYQTLFRYAQSLRRDPNFISDNNIDVMLLAHQLAPQVAEITLNAASMLIAHRDNGIAITLLRPLAADPHNAELAQAARQMIEVANGGAPSSAPANAPASPLAPQRPH
jgi:hypothetical protein